MRELPHYPAVDMPDPLSPDHALLEQATGIIMSRCAVPATTAGQLLIAAARYEDLHPLQFAANLVRVEKRGEALVVVQVLACAAHVKRGPHLRPAAAGAPGRSAPSRAPVLT